VRTIKTNNRMTKKNWIIFGIIVCCIYIISPVDLMPEIVLGPFGMIDDAGVLGFMLFLVKKLWVLRSDAQSGEEGMKQAVVEVDDVKNNPNEPPELSDGV